MLKTMMYVGICFVLVAGIGFAYRQHSDEQLYLKRCPEILAKPDLQAFDCSAWMEANRPEVYEDGSTSGPKPGELWPGPRSCAEAAERHNTNLHMQERSKEKCRSDPSSGG